MTAIEALREIGQFISEFGISDNKTDADAWDRANEAFATIEAALNARLSLSAVGEEKEHRPDCEADAGDMAGECTCNWLNAKDRECAPGDVVERLRQYPCPRPIDHDKAVDCVAAGQCGCCEKDVVDAIALLEQQAALIAEMRLALKPFEEAANLMDGEGWRRVDDGTLLHRTSRLKHLTVGDLRRARIAATKEG